jgi:chromosome partitioning protein
VPIITIASQKGGSGKTTLAVSLADALTIAGERVLLIDADPQRSALAWASAAPPDVAAPTVIAADAHTLAPRHLDPLASVYTWIIVDTAPRIGEATLAALRAAHVVLVPVRPSPVDLAALPAIQAALEVTPNARRVAVRCVVTQRPARSAVADSASAAIEGAGLVALDAALGFRADYIEAATQGRGVVSIAPKSKAAAEVGAVLTELRALLPQSSPHVEEAYHSLPSSPSRRRAARSK